MTRFNRTLFFATLVCATAGIATTASAAINGYAERNISLRAGPGTDYPAIGTLRRGAKVKIQGCLDHGNQGWCDVKAGGWRGWAYADYLQTYYKKRPVSLIKATSMVDVPVIEFKIGDYWDSHYKNRSFYRDRSRWEGRDDNDHNRHSDRDDNDHNRQASNDRYDNTPNTRYNAPRH